MKKYKECFRSDGLCGVCAASSYGKDCMGKEIGKLLHYRSLEGATQKEIADRAGMNVRQYQKLESGENKVENMTLINAIALADAFEVDVKDLI